MKTKTLGLKNAGFFQRHRCALFFFLYVVLYNFIITNRCQIWQVSLSAHTFHLVDYSVGFCTRVLPGAIYQGLFGVHGNRTITSVYETLLLLLFFLVLAFVLETVLNHVDESDRVIGLFVIILFLSGPCTFSIFVDELGMLDVYWVFFALLFFLCLKSKWARWLIPALCFAVLLVNLSAMISYIVMFFIVMLYKMMTEEKKKSWIILFSLSLVVTLATFFYFLRFETSNLLLTMDEFNAMLDRKGGGYKIYYDYYFYGETWEQELRLLTVPDAGIGKLFVNLINKIIVNYTIVMQDFAFDYFAGSFFCLVTILPVVVCIYKGIIAAIKMEQTNRKKNFALVLMLVQFPFTVILGGLFSIDLMRWISHAFIILFAMFLFLVKDKRTVSLLSIYINLKNPLFYIWTFLYIFTWSSAYSG